MEVIYPRDNRKDSEVAGVIGDGGVIENQEINQTFNDWLTQYFNEDNSKTIIETINNYAGSMPDIGLNELLIAYMAKFEAELKRIKEAIQNMDLGDKLIENHTVIDLGAFNWNGNVENIYMLSGGVPSTITINQYINNICGVAIFGSEFQTLDAATGLINLSVYPVDYIQTLLDNNTILTIGVDKYVPLTICDITINNNELGNQLPPVTETGDETGSEVIDNDNGFLYNHYAVMDARKLSSGDDWRVPTKDEFVELLEYLGDKVVYIDNANPLDETNISALKLQMEGIVWPGEDGLNTFGFNALPSGNCSYNQTFSGLGLNFNLWSSTPIATDAYKLEITGAYNYARVTRMSVNQRNGNSVRFIKDAPGVADGVKVIYTGNNQKKYEAVCIGGKYW
ncbi:FISUMP domain-containing protein, partial [Mariniphaga sediminis]|uniref:FISUMP domain-containing protein n=1 Tax=Mariniphaga sediminis TaxID=1628158 RepID=UPI003566577D